MRRRAKGNTMERENDFSQGSIAKNILNLAVPMTLAQLINVLYSVVDRVYIGHLQGVSANALTGIGLALPIITIITAFANLFGMGGSPLCSIARGQGKNDECLCLEKIQDKWSVYYLERGIKTTNEIFDSENDACQFLYDQLMN